MSSESQGWSSLAAFRIHNRKSPRGDSVRWPEDSFTHLRQPSDEVQKKFITCGEELMIAQRRRTESESTIGSDLGPAKLLTIVLREFSDTSQSCPKCVIPHVRFIHRVYKVNLFVSDVVKTISEESFGAHQRQNIKFLQAEVRYNVHEVPKCGPEDECVWL